MRKLLILAVILSIHSLSLAQTKAVVITVDGLNLGKTVEEIRDRIGDNLGLTDDMCREYNQKAWENYLGEAVEGMGLNDLIEIVPFKWSRNAELSIYEVEQLRNLIKKQAADAEGTKKVIVIAHSWGTVLAYAALNQLGNDFPGIDLFITLGSPLGSSFARDNGGIEQSEMFVNNYIEEKLNELKLNETGCRIKAVKWTNYWNWGDLFSGPVNKRCSFAEDRRFEINQATSFPRNFFSTFNWHAYNSLQDKIYGLQTHNEALKNAVKDLILQELQPGNSLAKNTVSNNNITLGFILDSSGSMKENDPGDIRKTAMNIIIDQLTGNENLFIVDFDQNAAWINPDNYKNINRNQLKAAVDRVNSDGGTNIGKGLDELQKAFIEARVSGKSGVILLSDGLGEYSNQAEWFMQKGIPVYTVSFIGQDNSKLLSSIAGLTHGSYSRINRANEIVPVFNQFLNNISGNSLVTVYGSTITLYSKILHYFIIDPFIRSISLQLMWKGSTIGLSLRSPDGKEYSYSHPEGNWTSGSNYSLLNIENPIAGVWEAEFYGADVPPGGEEFMFTVSADSKRKIELKDGISSSGIDFKLSLEENMSKEVSSRVRIITPTQKVESIENPISGGRFSYIPTDGGGNYNFDFEVLGNDYQRYFKRSVFIGENESFYSGKIVNLIGSYVKVSIGKSSGLFNGIDVRIRSALSNILVAEGFLINVNENESLMEVKQYMGNGQINVGDIVEYDLKRWLNDE